MSRSSLRVEPVANRIDGVVEPHRQHLVVDPSPLECVRDGELVAEVVVQDPAHLRQNLLNVITKGGDRTRRSRDEAVVDVERAPFTGTRGSLQ